MLRLAMLLHASVCAGGRPLIEQDSIIRLIRELRFRSQGFTRVSTADCLHTRNLHDGRSLSCSYLLVSWRHLPTDTRSLPISYFPDCPVALPVQQQSLRIRQRSVEDRPSSNGVSHVAPWHHRHQSPRPSSSTRVQWQPREERSADSRAH